MKILKDLLRNGSGFTFVEVMVVIVVLGVFANITIPHLSDWQRRIQADRDAEKAAISYLLGAAVDVVSRNHGGYMYEDNGYGQNATIRWQRPCRQAPVTQLMSRDEYDEDVEDVKNYVTGYTNIINWTLHDWEESQKWNVTDYIEHFPVGYAVEIVFAARNINGDIESDNIGPNTDGYHDKSGNSTPYDEDRIIIYQFIGDVVDNGYWSTWDPLAPNNYPYVTGGTELTHEHWEIVFPDSQYH